MQSHKTKKSKGNGAIASLLLGILGFVLFAFWQGLPHFAIADSSSSVTVTGVANVTEYLTSLVLYKNDPMESNPVVLKFNPEINALVVDSSVNANSLAVGKHVSVSGDKNVILGGEGNASSAGKYSVIIGGKHNRIGGVNTEGVIIGGQSSYINAGVNGVIVGSSGSSIEGGTGGVILGGGLASADSSTHHYLLVGGYGSTAGNNSVIMGKNINVDFIERVFVWSNTGGLNTSKMYSGGFYVNADGGFGFNVDDPKLKFDVGGAIKTISNDNIASLITCEEASKGLIAYIKNDARHVAGMCGCNGSTWIPLSKDPIIQYACSPENTEGKKCYADGELVDASGASELDYFGGATGFQNEGDKRWFQELNDGLGGWDYLLWTYGGVDSVNGSSNECSYGCDIGYHPGVHNPDGWYTGSCHKCTSFDGEGNLYTGMKNGFFTSAGTGINNCEFKCFGGYKYNSQERKCSMCDIGTWTLTGNRSNNCEKCGMPKGISNVGVVFTGGSDNNGYPYFFAFTTTGESFTGCNFDCRAGYYKEAYSCRECEIGKYSDDKATSCSSCTNRPDPITFFWKEGSVINTGSIDGSNLFQYTSNGKNGPGSCDWKCNSDLVKVGDQCVCVDIENQHLEIVGGVAKCVDNQKEGSCGGTEPTGAGVLVGPSAGHLVGFGSWTGWTWNSTNWNYVTGSSVGPTYLGVCQRSCQQGYKKSGNGCIKLSGGICNSDYNGGTFEDLTGGLGSLNDLCTAGNAVDLMYHEFNEDDDEIVEELGAEEATWQGRREWRCETTGVGSSDLCEAYKGGGVPKEGECDYSVGDFACLTRGAPIRTGRNENGYRWSCKGEYGGASVDCIKCNPGSEWSPGLRECTVGVYAILYNNVDEAINSNPSSYTILDTITLTDPVKTGYIFVGWTGSNGSTPQKNVTIPSGSTGDRFYNAVWASETDVTYFVHHLKQTLDGEDEYEIFEIFTGYAPANEMVTVPSNIYTGFLPVGEQSHIISSDGTTVFEFRYPRKVITLTFDSNGGTPVSPISGRYESPVTAPQNPTRVGYTFRRWNPALPSVFPAVSGTYQAMWLSNGGWGGGGILTGTQRTGVVISGFNGGGISLDTGFHNVSGALYYP